jgi:dTDP-4-amino-4,6-dideoxygalactose transaminase
VSAWRIPLFDTRFGPEEEAAVLRPLRAGWLTMGDELVELVAELREATVARDAMAGSSC